MTERTRKKPVRRAGAASRQGRVTLARALSKLGALSRSQARAAVLAGRVSIGGLPAVDPDAWVDPSRLDITLDGARLLPAPFVYLVMHKPPGVVTTRSDERGRQTVYDLLPRLPVRVFPVGRLDLDSSGLLLFTNDTRFGNLLTDPERHVPKSYLVEVDRRLGPREIAELRAPQVLPDGRRLRGAEVRPVGGTGTRFRVTIEEGKNRQIRRLFAAHGAGVLALCRTSVGGLRIGGLREGETRRLTPAEVEMLRVESAGR